MNRDVLHRTPEQNIEWLNSFFLLRWLDGVNRLPSALEYLEGERVTGAGEK